MQWSSEPVRKVLEELSAEIRPPDHVGLDPLPIAMRWKGRAQSQQSLSPVQVSGDESLAEHAYAVWKLITEGTSQEESSTAYPWQTLNACKASPTACCFTKFVIKQHMQQCRVWVQGRVGGRGGPERIVVLD